MKHSFPLLLFTLASYTSTVFAQDSAAVKKPPVPIQRFYVANALDGAIFSISSIQHTSPSGTANTSNGIVRFSWFLNIGVSFNVNFNRHFGAYAGIDAKNIGYIEK